MKPKCDLGLIGLATMGQNLALNIAEHKFQIAVFNRTIETTRRFIQERASGFPITPSESLGEFVSLLKKPRAVLLMVKAGKPVDEMLKKLCSFLEPGDLIADCGNSFFLDTEHRARKLKSKGLIYLGVGISGGEEGARKGPSIMPGGDKEGWLRLKLVFEAISAKVKGKPCVVYIGPGGAGHFVKMVHNGLEYGEMQLVAESYHLLKQTGGFSNQQLARTYQQYNQGLLAGYLMEITAKIFQEKDPATKKDLIDLILDRAFQKGTGQWTSQTALENEVPVPTINSAVEARFMSASKDERLKMAQIFPAPSQVKFTGELKKALENALYCAKLSLYAQGFSLLQKVSQEKGYQLNFANIARIWKGGCIIRSVLLETIEKIFIQTPDLTNLFMSPEVSKAIKQREKDWRNVLAYAIQNGIPVPALSSSLAYYDSLRSAWLPASLIQAQRDFFGAHTFERIDQKGTFHHQWASSKNFAPGEK